MIKLSELTVAQVEAIETMSEVGFDAWTSPRTSKAALYGSMLVILCDKSAQAVADMTMAELVTTFQENIDMSGPPKPTLNRAARRAAGR